MIPTSKRHFPSILSRRRFLGSAAAAGVSFSFPLGTAALLPDALHDTAHRSSKKITFLEDGGFVGSAWGWQFTPGAKLDRSAGHGSLGAVHVKTSSGDYARFLVLGPVAGTTYTLSGWIRTQRVVPSEVDAGAYYAASQFEFQGRPTEFTVDGKQATEIRYGQMHGTSNWQRFSQSVKCLPTTSWFEVAVGIYRASGEAWFSGLTFVQGDEPVALSDTMLPHEAAALAQTHDLLAAPRIKPRAAILDDDELPVRRVKTDVANLSRLLGASYDVEHLNALEFSDRSSLNRKRFDLVVLPYGETFPLAAKDVVLDFLAQGGDLLTTGGYAFQSPVVQQQGRWKFLDELNHEKQDTPNLLPPLALPNGWKPSHPSRCTLWNSSKESIARVEIKTPLREQSEAWTFDLAAEGQGRQFTFSAEWRTSDVEAAPSGAAIIGVEQLDSHGEPAYAARIDFEEIRGNNDWHIVRRLFYLVPDCVTLRIHAGLSKANGAIELRNVQLIERHVQVRVNTALGWPEDSLRVSDRQLGLFDADYRLRRVKALQTSSFSGSTTVKSLISAEGYAASGITNMNAARWVPLLEALDDFGRPRGAAAAILHHYSGEYVRSSWAFFGIDSHDIFSEDCKAGLASLCRAARTLASKCFLHSLETNYSTYRDGEPVKIRVLLSNYSLRAFQLEVKILVHDGSAAATERIRSVHIKAGKTFVLEEAWTETRFHSPHYRVIAELHAGSEQIDTVESAFNIWNPQILAHGMPFEFRENYFQVEGKSVFLQGTDDYLHTFINQDENAGTWLADAQGCRDSSIDVYENLMGLRGPQHRPTETWWRWVDAMVLNTQRVGGIFFPGMLVFSNTAVSEADLADQKSYVRAFAQRYSKAAGIMYYLNGDLELHDPNLPDLERLYNDFLRAKYGNDTQLRSAWRLSPPEAPLGELRIRRRTDLWQDTRTADDFRFRTYLVKRWLDAMHDSIREVDAIHPVTAEFYQEPVSGIDLLTALGKLELANFGYFAEKDKDYYRFPQVCRFLDQSMRGKGINIGEFGVKTHPAWNDAGYYIEARTEQYEQSYFLSLTHYAFALGASKVQNWCWKYPADLPFEWGINYPNELVPRDVRAFYRNSGLLLRSLHPRFKVSETIVLLASESRMGGQGLRIVEGQLNCIRLLLDANVQFGTLTDDFLFDLPPQVRTILYPLSYCPSDEVIDQLTNFVEAGGQLYLSGDISYDARRDRTRTDRLVKLCGVAFIAERYPDIDYGDHSIGTAPTDQHWPTYQAAPTLQVRLAGARELLPDVEGYPVVTSFQRGAGRVILSLDPIELHGDPRFHIYAHQFYSALLETLAIQRATLTSNFGAIHLFSVPSQDSRAIHVLVNHGDEPDNITFSTPSGQIRLQLGSRLPGVAVTSVRGLQAVETSGNLYINNSQILESDLHLILICLDEKSIAESCQLLILPMATGSFTLHRTEALHNPVLLVGEISEGKWRQNFDAAISFTGATLSVTIDNRFALAMLLLCEGDTRDAAIKNVETLSQTPWKMET